MPAKAYGRSSCDTSTRAYDIARCCPAAGISGKGEVLAILACPGAPGPIETRLTQ
jgi:hypothetical protein